MAVLKYLAQKKIPFSLTGKIYEIPKNTEK